MYTYIHVCMSTSFVCPQVITISINTAGYSRMTSLGTHNQVILIRLLILVHNLGGEAGGNGRGGGRDNRVFLNFL